MGNLITQFSNISPLICTVYKMITLQKIQNIPHWQSRNIFI